MKKKKLTFLSFKKKIQKLYKKTCFKQTGRHRLQRRLHGSDGLPDDVRGHVAGLQGPRGRPEADQEDLQLKKRRVTEDFSSSSLKKKKKKKNLLATRCGDGGGGRGVNLFRPVLIYLCRRESPLGCSLLRRKRVQNGRERYLISLCSPAPTSRVESARALPSLFSFSNTSTLPRPARTVSRVNGRCDEKK